MENKNDDSKIFINLMINDREIRVKVLPEQEEIFRRAAKSITQKTARYKQNHPTLDYETAKAFCVLDFAVEKLQLQNQKSTEALFKTLNQLSLELDDVTQL